MTNKERLEQIKRQRQKKSTALDYIDLDIDWLIEQAEIAEFWKQRFFNENKKLLDMIYEKTMGMKL